MFRAFNDIGIHGESCQMLLMLCLFQGKKVFTLNTELTKRLSHYKRLEDFRTPVRQKFLCSMKALHALILFIAHLVHSFM